MGMIWFWVVGWWMFVTPELPAALLTLVLPMEVMLVVAVVWFDLALFWHLLQQ